jgi:hypothetical protein
MLVVVIIENLTRDAHLSNGTTKSLYGVDSPSSGVYVVVGDGVMLRNVQSDVDR